MTEVGAPMRTEPRLSVASTIYVGADSHIVAGNLAVEMRSFVHGEGARDGIPAAAVLVEMKLRAHRRVRPSVGLNRHHVAVRMNDLLVRLDPGLGEGERERPIADTLVAEPISLRRPETYFVRARLAMNPIELLDLSLPASAERRGQHRIRLRRHRSVVAGRGVRTRQRLLRRGRLRRRHEPPRRQQLNRGALWVSECPRQIPPLLPPPT